MATTVNPYADRAAAQMAVQQQPAVVQQPYNLFAQQKQAGYPVVNTPQAGPRMAGEAGTVHTTPITQPAQIVQNTGGDQRNATPITSMEDLAMAMGYTSPQEEERLRKASVANQRILAIGDALRHIGNIANTVNYAPSQQFTNPVVEEEQRYQKGKALRDAANLKYYTYQQAKAAQDQKARQWEQQMKYNMVKDARDYQLKKSESEARNNLREAQLNRYQTMMALDEARREGIISDNEYKKRKAELYPSLVQSQIARNNRTGGGRSGGGSPGKYWDYDEDGNIHYYPNKTMWEQGVESHTRGQKQQEEFKTIDGYGDQKVTYKKRPTVSKAGENAHNAAAKKAPQKKKALPGQTNNSQQKTKKKLP